MKSDVHSSKDGPLYGLPILKGSRKCSGMGGGDYSIHGKSVRKLPDLWLYRLRKVASWPDPLIKVQLLADGYSKEISIPVEFVIDDEPVFLSNSENHRVDEWL